MLSSFVTYSEERSQLEGGLHLILTWKFFYLLIFFNCLWNLWNGNLCHLNKRVRCLTSEVVRLRDNMVLRRHYTKGTTYSDLTTTWREILSLAFIQPSMIRTPFLFLKILWQFFLLNRQKYTLFFLNTHAQCKKIWLFHEPELFL